MKPRLRVGIDVGGTFTDLFLFDEASGTVRTHKVSSTPEDPHRAPIQGLKELLALEGASGEQVGFVGLGTTVATNALLEGKGARTGLITTRGFRDLLEIARQTRPHLYDPFAQKPKLLVPRHLRCEVTERLGADGSVVQPLSDDEVLEAVAQLRRHQVESVAICFLNSYVDPQHENRAVDLVRRHWPDANVVSSYEVLPEFREYERLVSTIVNAYLMPSIRGYFARFEREVAALGIPVTPVVMSSSGGVFTPHLAGQRPIDTLFSGPSGGVSSAVFIGAHAQRNNIITFDMGGTSTEVCLVRDGRPQLTHTRHINGYPIRTTSYDIHTIGAGGSSIAAVDAGGMLQVGPESAGADPGPACYSTGGRYATVTDANVVLGRLNQHHLLAGSLKIDSHKSASAMETQVAAPKKIGLRAAATAVVALAEANMAQALRVVSVQRGIDPKDYTLVALGGAGPLHAATVARQVGMAGVLIPLHPGVLCAMGVLTKDIQLNFSRTRLIIGNAPDAASTTAGIYAELEEGARAAFGLRLEPGQVLRYERSAAVRYRGQNHELSIDFPPGRLGEEALADVAESFHLAHRELYGYSQPDQPIELVTLRLAAIIQVERPTMPRVDTCDGGPSAKPAGRRDVSFDGLEHVSCAVYDRSTLTAGHEIHGPAVIEQMDTTTVIPPGFRAQVDTWLNLNITWTH